MAIAQVAVVANLDDMGRSLKFLMACLKRGINFRVY